jgi:hypothetical protein
MMTNFTEIKCSCGANAPASKRIPFDDGDYYLCDDKRCKSRLELELEKADFARSFQRNTARVDGTGGTEEFHASRGKRSLGTSN